MTNPEQPNLVRYLVRISAKAVLCHTTSHRNKCRISITVRKRIDLSHYRVAQNKWHNFMCSFVYALTSSNINRFSKLFHCQNQKKMCNNTITKDPITPQVCRYTALWNVKCLTSNNWKQHIFSEINNKGTTCLLSQLLAKVSHFLNFFSSNVQFVRFAAGRPTQAGDATDQWSDQWNAPTL